MLKQNKDVWMKAIRTAAVLQALETKQGNDRVLDREPAIYTCILLNQHNQEKRTMSPDPFPVLWVGSGDETSAALLATSVQVTGWYQAHTRGGCVLVYASSCSL